MINNPGYIKMVRDKSQRQAADMFVIAYMRCKATGMAASILNNRVTKSNPIPTVTVELVGYAYDPETGKLSKCDDQTSDPENTQ